MIYLLLGVASSVVAVVALPLPLPQPERPPEAAKSPGPPKLPIRIHLARAIWLVRQDTFFLFFTSPCFLSGFLWRSPASPPHTFIWKSYGKFEGHSVKLSLRAFTCFYPPSVWISLSPGPILLLIFIILTTTTPPYNRFDCPGMP